MKPPIPLYRGAPYPCITKRHKAFRSAIHRVAKVVQGPGKTGIVLCDRPVRLAVLDGLKVEGIALRELPGKGLDLFVGSDDENHGGSLRPVPLPVDGSGTKRSAPP